MLGDPAVHHPAVHGGCNGVLVQQVVEQSARRYPKNTAVIFKNRRIGCHELDLASVRAGVGRGDRVGIYLRRCAGAVAAIFGALKAGAAHVPLDATALFERVCCQVEC